MGALEDLRELNRLRVVDELRARGPLSRSAIAAALGLSRTTITSVVGELLSSRLVVERPAERHAGRGRPAALLSLDASAGSALGIDFGHEHVRVAVADLASTILIERCVDLDIHTDAHAALDEASALAHQLLDEAGVPSSRVVGAGMGLPGPIDPRAATLGGSAVLRNWAGMNVARELGRRLRVPVTVDNDANLGALAETQVGVARGHEDVIYVKVSSGIGAGLVFGGRLHQGVTGIAGEIGHVQVRADGDLCRCGNRGCLETVASSTALLAALRPAYGGGLSVLDMLALAAGGDIGVRRVIRDAGRAVGRTLADVCNSLNPETIVVGGELAAAEFLLEGIRESIDRYAQPGAARAVRVTAGSLGPRAPLIGALMLVTGDAGRLRSAGLAVVAP